MNMKYCVKYRPLLYWAFLRPLDKNMKVCGKDLIYHNQETILVSRINREQVGEQGERVSFLGACHKL